MVEDTSLQFLRVRSYLENRRLGRDFLPANASGVYWFVRDLAPLFNANDDQALSEWFERPRRWFEGDAPLYYKVRIAGSVRKLGRAKARHLRNLVNSVGANALSAPLLLTQRPLYIGESRDLKGRISDHIEGRTDLVELLEAADLSLSDCVVLWTVLPSALGELDAGKIDDSEPKSDRRVLEALAIRLSQPLLNRKLE